MSFFRWLRLNRSTVTARDMDIIIVCTPVFRGITVSSDVSRRMCISEGRKSLFVRMIIVLHLEKSIEDHQGVPQRHPIQTPLTSDSVELVGVSYAICRRQSYIMQYTKEENSANAGIRSRDPIRVWYH